MHVISTYRGVSVLSHAHSVPVQKAHFLTFVFSILTKYNEEIRKLQNEEVRDPETHRGGILWTSV